MASNTGELPGKQRPRRLLQRMLPAFLISLLSQLFFIVLLSSSFSDYRAETYGQLTAANCAMTAQKLTVVGQLGRRVENYAGAAQDLYDLKMLSHAADAFIINEQGSVIVGQSIYGLTALNPADIKDGQYLAGSGLYQLRPFYDNSGRLQGYVAALPQLPEAEGSALAAAFGDGVYLRFAGMVLCSLVFFAIGIKAALHFKLEGFKRKACALLLPCLLSQLITAGLAAPQFFTLVSEHGSRLEQSISASLSQHFREVKVHDIALQDISGYERYFAALKSELPAAGALSVSDAAGVLIAGDSEAASGTVLPVFSDSRLLGFINVSAAGSVIASLGRELGLTLLTLFIVSAVLSFELSSLVALEQTRLEKYKAPQKGPFEPELIRPLSFLNIFALFLPITIVPVHMADFAADFPGLSLQLVQSLSVCTEMVCIALCSFYILLTRSYAGRWQVLGRGCLALLGAAALIAALAPNGYVYLLSRALYGLGYGALLAYCQLFAVASSTEATRGQSMTALSAGLYSGVLCSAAAGGIIADSLGFNAVFLTSAGLFALNLLLFFYLNSGRSIAAAAGGKAAAAQESTQAAAQEAKAGGAAAIAALLRQPKILSLLLCQALPYSIIGIGFFNYLLPVSFAEHQLGAAMLGQLNFVYAFIIILISPLTGRLIDKLQQKAFVVLALSLVASSLVPLLFNLPNFIAAAFLVMVMLGLSASINEGGQPAFISKLAAAQHGSPESAVLLLDAVLRIGQSCAPLLMALILTLASAQAFAALAGLIICCALLFLLLQTAALLKDRRQAAAQSAAGE
ncbi:MAG: MFS transporter [Proteobacteria bacterium]|uniref:MFS transporter n=1 Tax=Candidatus Avisuccinivibrio stercorigallinarum TaxID=2840704 RepID=A0A9D9DBL9_9GAMM|nr:MFS transporter [Candidatus Avisuccinivibrio stercorigallinarum]